MLKVKNIKQYHCKTLRRYIIIHGPLTLEPGFHALLHEIKAFGGKIIPPLKKSFLFHELKDMKSWYCDNNHSR